ncbi:hypothetical protein [Paenibacillus eucommiae]|uniref:Photosystem II stability/assembly factor-like uncharacterized protein n=1 Tax=Paenibacillus eucommiae TaxID=1355755 RepID=A0ABS4JAR8_9BACL|nr:hypothetical protein [Paenibacillus eucommiae]MBP1996900.1 photosystem II stability/assembly factor-like uncharacterized protein [Paenibacillus eucommiae]
MNSLRILKFPVILCLMFIILAGCQSQASTSTPDAGGGSPSPTATDNGASTTPSTEPSPEPTTGPSASPSTGAGASPNSNTPADGSMGKVTAVRLADAQSGWVGGEGWIARTDDGGKKWKTQYKGKGTIKQLFALNSKEAWATIDETPDQNSVKLQLLSTTDGGKNWKVEGSVPNLGFLHFVSSNEAFSANAMTKDRGKTWITMPVPDSIIGDAYFHDKNNGWALTSTKDKLEIKRTTDGGQKWSTVMSRDAAATPNGAVIRSAGANDAWVEIIGDSGMSQTSYSLFHTSDGGKNWQTVIANSTAGAGPAPGFPLGYDDGPKNNGSKPGTLYVVNPQVAFMGGQCPACDEANTVGWTKDDGKTWTNGKQAFKGYGEQGLAMADANQGWLITTDNTEPSVMYTTSDGGQHWNKVHTFDKP